MNDPITRLDNFHTETMGYPLAEAKPGEIHVIASERRFRKEEGYGVVFAFWMLLSYDRCIISVRPDLKESIEQIVKDAADAKEFFTGKYRGRIMDGKLVSLASVVPTPEAISKYRLSWPGVETLPDYRRRGYAKAVISGVTETLLSGDITPVYSCSVTNIASANTARSVGYQLYGERLQWRYQPG